MTKEEIIEMVMQIGGCDRPEDDSPALKMFVTFAKLVAEKAIKEALAQPEQEPVAWMDKDGDVLSASVVSGKGLRNIPLYTTPPQRTWVGLTDEERNDCLVDADPCECLADPEAEELMRCIEAKLKEKNT
jgi:hypothetical protein